MTARQPNAFGGTFVFFLTHRPMLKNPKEPPSQRTKTLQLWTDKPRPKKNNEGITFIRVINKSIQKKR